MSKIALTPSATGTGVFTISSPATNTDRTLTLPDEAGSIVVNTATGIDVTGTVTADGLTVDGNATISSAAGSLYLEDNNYTAGQKVFGVTSKSGDLFFRSFTDDKLTATNRFGIDHSTGDISFYEDTGTTAKFFWDASAESLGIGTSSPSLGSNGTGLHIKGASGDYGVLKVDSSTTSEEGWVQFSNNGVDKFRIASDSSTNLKFIHSGVAERMRIDSSGNLLVGTTDSNPYNNSAGSTADNGIALGATGIISSAKYNDNCAAFNRTGTDGGIISFRKSGSNCGSISVTASSTAYNTSSDYRLKTDAQPMTGASARVLALKPVNFAWIVDGSRVDGFLAHEAQAVVPEAVHGTKDAMRDEEYEVTAAVYEDIIIAAVLDEEGNELEAERTEQRLVTEAVMGTRSVPDMQGIDQSKLVPLLTAALQEALNKIEAMETRLAALEAV
jgi:hypothetical protein